MVGAETDGGCRMRLEEGEGARSSLGLHGQGNPPAGAGGGGVTGNHGRVFRGGYPRSVSKSEGSFDHSMESGWKEAWTGCGQTS